MRWSAARLVIEPVLWLALVIGLLWLMAALDATVHVGDDHRQIPDGFTTRAAWSAVSLLPISGVALTAWSIEHRGAGRAWTLLAGVALIGTGPGWGDLDGMGWLTWLSVVLGVAALAGAIAWPAWAPYADEQPRTWPVLAAAVAVTPIIAVGALGVQAGFVEGLASAPPGSDPGWAHLIVGLVGLVLGAAAMLRLLQARPGGAIAALLLSGAAVIGTVVSTSAVVGGVVSIGQPVETDPPGGLAFAFVSYTILLAVLSGWAWYLLAYAAHDQPQEEPA